ncbi:hypothetical protein [Lapillicoccus sp.]|uniref:hypothetical protein n=1 Tax=Lapillicoccus sp. TaxID=1909287 RepID=UPI00326342E2
MKTIAKVLEVMLSTPATPTWTPTAGPGKRSATGPSTPPNLGPVGIWGWGGS